ncbi:MAG: AMP-binding protein [Actinobacteria bacterium]|nr:AMP-binding protein [Actinomycetota bacterium]
MLDNRADTVAGLIDQRAGENAEGLRFEGASWTWDEVVTQMQRRATLLTELLPGGAPRHFGVLLDNVPEFLFLLGGAALSGAVLVGLNPTRRGAELERDIRHTDCALVLTSPDHAPLLDGLDLGLAHDAVRDVEDAAWQEAMAGTDPAAPVPVTIEDLLLLLFTSGSTGAPKAVRMTQGRAAATARRMWFSPDDVLYCAMPMFHGNALVSTVLPAIGSGATLVMKRRFSASEFMADVRAHGVTFFSTVGRALSYILAVPETPEDADNRLGVVLTPESSPDDMAALQERFDCYAVSGYGSSENAVILAPQPGLPEGALGTPLEGTDAAVVDPDTLRECPRARFDEHGRMLNPDEAIGELVGRNVLERFEGYYNNPEAEASRTRNGWYWTGDLAYRDEDGVFFFAGRTNDWLRVDGENFAAAPVERVLSRYPHASAVAVVGVPDERTVDDQVLAILEVDDPTTFDPPSFDAFLDQQRDMGTKWSPRYVRVVAEMPMTATNKIDRSALRRSGWDADDPVYWRPDRRGALQRMTATEREELRRVRATRQR